MTAKLLECLNNCLLMLNEKLNNYTMHIDLEKASNSLICEKLLFMLSKLGVEGNFLTWFSSFLTGLFFKYQCTHR